MYSYFSEYNSRTRPPIHHHINPGALQTQYPPTQYPPTQYPPTQYPPTQYPPTQYPPTPPVQETPPTGEGCMNKWATFRLKDGRVIQMYVTFIGSKSVAGSVSVPGGGWKQVALDLGEILESQC
ncbi:hypothetical protein [Bacillus cereus group sp. BfR-BA-01423]|uniref:hypothetical protein n=1 Tax=Bacillus cereus group sp. BfR-BA-01423 TaxID=2920340 RepID=UPI001F574622|nr:hypothetical protein [Bacillus cereus group sp. BfR-BA-01423]